MFGLSVPDAPRGIGHYHVGSAGDFSAQGWSVSVSRAMAEGIRASVDYTLANTHWSAYSADMLTLQCLAPAVVRTSERVHDMTATLDSVVAPTATRVFVLYKVNSAFARTRESLAGSMANARFNVQVNQSLPFLRLRGADFEMLVAVSNLFRNELLDASVYDELFVVEPPKRVLGGVTVRF